MNKPAHLYRRARNLALLLGLTAVPPALAACPPDTFADQADFSHVDVDPLADGAQDRFGYVVATNGQIVASGTRG